MKARHRHSLTISGIIVLLALLLGVNIHFFSSHSIAKASLSPGPVTIMPLGDSITFGIGSPTYSSYRLALWQDLTAAGIKFSFVGSEHSGSKVLGQTANEGHSGWHIRQISAHIVNWLQLYQPKYVLLHIGTNDIWFHDDVTHAPQRLKLLIDQITSTLPGVTVLVAQITPLAPQYEAQVETFNKAIPGLVSAEIAAGKRVQYVDVHDFVPLSDLPDKVHPNDTGYRLMAEAWYLALHPLLSEASLPGTISVDDALTGSGLDQFHYSGSWNHCTQCGDELYAQSNSWDNTAGDYVTLPFQGVAVYVYVVKDNMHGIAAISIDGTSGTEVDLYASERTGDQRVWLSPVLGNGEHILKIRVTGTKNSESSDTYISLDRVKIVPDTV
jgi:lysophospholipase L1-like esterase